MDWHVQELIEHQPDIDVELPVDLVGVEEGVHFRDDLTFSFDLHVDLFQDLAFFQTEAGVHF